jgi:hypothetical protein
MVRAQKGQPRWEKGKCEWIDGERKRLMSVDLQKTTGEVIGVDWHLLKYGRSVRSNLKQKWHRKICDFDPLIS